MAKLNPPYIDNILPPFAIDNEGKGVIQFQFTLNRMVSQNDILVFEGRKKVAILIKDALTNSVIFDSTQQNRYCIATFDENTPTIGNILFYTDTIEFHSGQYYKIQIALIDTNNIVGYYSTIGISRCILKPILRFANMETASNCNIIPKPQYEYTGQCILNEPTEKIYSYSFVLTDEDDNIIFTTGEQIHNCGKDTSKTLSEDTCYLTQSLNFNQTYIMRYSITTINGYKDSVVALVKAADTVNISLGNNLLIADPDSENGTIIIKFMKKNSSLEFTPLTYNFILLRSSSQDNYKSWTRLTDFDEIFQLENALMIGKDAILWEDFTVEHGVSYRYALQAYNSFGLFSNRVESNLAIKETETGLPEYDDEGNVQYESIPTTIYFDDMYLSDGIRQLRIRFNPKVSSFKNTLLETKTNTIGSKYPFFFRNGTVNFKEFPISGLISLLMDPDDKFITGLYTENAATRLATPGTSIHANNLKTNLTDENIKNEREFKLEVLNWLTDGKPKIFRSSTEGNYIVRLMNTSLSPNDTLGRMLHTFSTSACEIDDYTFDNLDKYGFINFKTPKYKFGSFHGVEEVKLSDYINRDESPIISIPGAFHATIYDSSPVEATYNLGFSDIGSLNGIRLGKSKTYNVPLQGDTKLTSVSWGNWDTLKSMYREQNLDASFKLLYGYYDLMNLTNFHFIEDIQTSVVISQHIGELNYIADNRGVTQEDGTVVFEVEPSPIATQGIREIGSLHWIGIKRRPIIPIYLKDGVEYFNEACTDEFTTSHSLFLMQGLYNVFQSNDSGTLTFIEMRDYSQISNNKNYIVIDLTNDIFNYTLNGEMFTLNLANSKTKDLYFTNTDEFSGTHFELDTVLLANTSIETLSAGVGLIVEMCYTAKDLVYNFEKNNDPYGWINALLPKLSQAEQEQLEQALNDYIGSDFSVAKKNWQQHLPRYNGSLTYNQDEYIKAKLEYETAWKEYANALRVIIYYLIQNEEVVIS